MCCSKIQKPKLTCHLLFSYCKFQSFSQVLADVFANDSSTLANLSAIGSSSVCNCLLLDKVTKESLLEKEGKSALAKRLKEI